MSSTLAPARPMGDVIGRQPTVLWITPSQPNPWYGSIVGGENKDGAVIGGDPFTAEQVQALERAGIDPASVERITVRRNATHREMWWPLRTYPPVYEFACPVLGRRADGKVRIVSPSGVEKLVFADGWNTDKPARKKTDYAW